MRGRKRELLALRLLTRRRKKHRERQKSASDLAASGAISHLDLDLLLLLFFFMKKNQGVRSDVKFIACEACEALARHAANHVAELREEKKKEARDEGSPPLPSQPPPSRFGRAPVPKGAPTEAEILDAVEGMADPSADAGEWLTHFDLEVKRNSKLKLKDMGTRGKCGERCRTVAMAVADSLEGTDTDLAERLWRGGVEASPDEVARWLCREATGVCSSSSAPPPLPAARAAALGRDLTKNPFEPESAEDAQLRQMMASMKQQGMGGQMFDRQSVLKSLKEDEDDDDDEGEEEEGGTAEKESEAAADAKAKAALAGLEAEEEGEGEEKEGEEKEGEKAKKASGGESLSSGLSEKAERAKEAAKEGVSAARAWLSAKKASLFASSSSSSKSQSESTAEL